MQKTHTKYDRLGRSSPIEQQIACILAPWDSSGRSEIAHEQLDGRMDASFLPFQDKEQSQVLEHLCLQRSCGMGDPSRSPRN